MITEYAVPSLALNHHCKKYQFIYESVYSICVHAGETNTHARLNLYEMSTNK